MKFQSVVALVALLFFSLKSDAQTTAFAYQGKLSDNGSAANGNYDFRFRIFDVNTNTVAGPITNLLVNVTNGQFSTTLNFGGGVFDGSDRWLEIAVRSNATAFPFIPLAPLQPITSVPYAIQSLKAASAAFATNAQNAANATQLVVPLPGTNINGTIPIMNLPTNTAFLNSNQTFTGANTFSGAATALNAANNFAGTFSGTFNGNGANLTNIPATILTGTLPDVRLSSNVTLQNNTNIVFLGTVTAQNYVGAGHGLTNVPGAFFWVIVTNSAQSFPNVGYICSNNLAPVTITLPATTNISIGDTFKVAGVGNAGWTIAQNAGETIVGGNLTTLVGQNWNAVLGAANWAGIACSSDGQKLVAAFNGGNLYTSTNYGSTWASRDSARNWSSVASSADGTKMVATVGYSLYNAAASGQVYISSDSGASWVQPGNSGSLGNLLWSCCAVTGDGSKLVAGVRNGSIYTNNGANWNIVSGTSGNLWSGIASSFDGTKMVAVEANGSIFTSTTSGASWVSRTNIASTPWASVSSSSDGSRLVAVTTDRRIYLSTDSGATWLKQTTISSLASTGTAVASAADGNKMAFAIGGLSAGNIFASSDSGATWSQLTTAPSADWSGIASSADGGFLAATVYGGDIYVSSQSTTIGTSGYLNGAQHSAIELIYIGGGNFLPLNHEGTIRAF